MKKIHVILSIFLACFMFVVVGCGSVEKKNTASSPQELIVYAGAGLKLPMEDFKKDFESKHKGVTLTMIYAGSGQLLAQLEQSGKGDVFIVGSKATYDAAMNKSLTSEGFPVAHHTPVIVVEKGNPKGIHTLQDLTQPGIRVALGEPKSNAIGLTAQKIFEKNQLLAINNNVVVQTATVNELFMAIGNKTADAVIATRDGAIKQKGKMDIIEIPSDQNIDQIITIGSVKTTTDSQLSKEFIDLIKAKESKSIWSTYGFSPVD